MPIPNEDSTPPGLTARPLQSAARPCPTCAPLVVLSHTWTTKAQLVNSAYCSICFLLRTILDNFPESAAVQSLRGREGLFVLDVRSGGDEAGELGSIMLLAVNGEKCDSPFSWLPTLKKAPFSRTVARDVQLARKWLRECQEQHTACIRLSTRLPTRVVDVGSADRLPRLVTTNATSAPYLALSHRWGDSDNRRLVTTNEALPSLSAGIPLETWPRTFREAIEVTRALGIQFLWIDSLCIIQDDRLDWEAESAQMGDIYANATATIFAERSTHCDDGLFGPLHSHGDGDEGRKVHNWIQEIDYQNPVDKQRYSILVSTKPLRGALGDNSPASAFCLVDHHTSQLQSRGWILQEEMLSRRKLCFSSTELHWQCSQQSRCECDLRTDTGRRSHWDDMTRRLLFVRGEDGALTRGLSVRELSGQTSALDYETSTRVDRSWKQLIELYTARHLTNEGDRLPALSGVASQVLKLGRRKEDYLAGIWKQDPSQLLWFVPGTNVKPSRRQRPYSAPSWSWASVTGTVSFLDVRRAANWEVLSATCIPAGENIMGPVSSGWIRIKGSVIPVTVQPEEIQVIGMGESIARANRPAITTTVKEQNGKRYQLRMSLNQTGSVTSALNSLWKGKPQPQRVTLDAAEDWTRFPIDGGGSSSPKCLLLVVGLGWHGAESASEPLRPVGLLLRAARHDRKCWKRIALVALDDEWALWRPFAREKTILVV